MTTLAAGYRQDAGDAVVESGLGTRGLNLAEESGIQA